MRNWFLCACIALALPGYALRAATGCHGQGLRERADTVITIQGHRRSDQAGGDAGGESESRLGGIQKKGQKRLRRISDR